MINSTNLSAKADQAQAAPHQLEVVCECFVREPRPRFCPQTIQASVR
jgi:hypothetical protein